MKKLFLKITLFAILSMLFYGVSAQTTVYYEDFAVTTTSINGYSRHIVEEGGISEGEIIKKIADVPDLADSNNLFDLTTRPANRIPDGGTRSQFAFSIKSSSTTTNYPVDAYAVFTTLDLTSANALISASDTHKYATFWTQRRYGNGDIATVTLVVTTTYTGNPTTTSWTTLPLHSGKLGDTSDGRKYVQGTVDLTSYANGEGGVTVTLALHYQGSSSAYSKLNKNGIFYFSDLQFIANAGVLNMSLATDTPSISASETTLTATEGIAITPITINSTGGTVAIYSIAPNLNTDTGLDFNTNTGAISGTPTTVISATDYVITAMNATGTGTAMVNITVNAVALVTPPSIRIKTSTFIVKAGSVITDISLDSSAGGRVYMFSIDPPIGNGLSFDDTTGTIYGTPTAIAEKITYTITATNTAGMTTATVSIKVVRSLGDEDFEKTKFSISPNPVIDILNITVVEKADYRLLNIRGQVLKKGVLTTGKSKIDISSFAKGIYFLNLKTRKGIFTEKVVRD